MVKITANLHNPLLPKYHLIGIDGINYIMNTKYTEEWEVLKGFNVLVLLHFCPRTDQAFTTKIESGNKVICEGCLKEAPKSKAFITGLYNG